MTIFFESFVAIVVKYPLKSQAFQGPSFQTCQRDLISTRLVGDRDG